MVLVACGAPDDDIVEESNRPATAPQATPHVNAPTLLTDEFEMCAHVSVTPLPLDRHLIERVREEGTVSVIVTLDIPYEPEALLKTQAEIDEQRAAIASAQDELVASLADFNAVENTRYTIFPQIALTVDEKALQELARSPLVADVQENRAHPPTG
jgi:hypothetical protein